MAAAETSPMTVSHRPWTPGPTPMDRTSTGMTMVEIIPGSMTVPVEVGMARLSSRVESSGTIREWLRE